MKCSPIRLVRRNLGPQTLLAGLLFALSLGTAIGASEHSHPAPMAEKTQEHVHQHPAPQADSGVGLDERIGDYLPLDLVFRDETGQQVRLEQLIDRPTIIAPVYYKCPNVCNFLQAGLARVLGKVKQDPSTDFRVLSISFDETETPDLARKSKQMYFTAMGQPFPESAWRFLTGEPQQIHRLTEAAGYRFERRGIDFLHPVVIFVVAADGKIVRYLHGTEYLPLDLTLALVEASEGRVGTTIRKMVSFCFSYDPENRTYVFNLLRVTATVVLASGGAFLAFLILGGRKKKQY